MEIEFFMYPWAAEMHKVVDVFMPVDPLSLSSNDGAHIPQHIARKMLAEFRKQNYQVKSIDLNHYYVVSKSEPTCGIVFDIRLIEADDAILQFHDSAYKI